jgi:hypothetical protein
MFGDALPPPEGFGLMVDENGMPIDISGQPYGPPPAGTPGLRPDGTGEPSQQELDQAFPPAQGANRYPQRPPQPFPPPPPQQQPRPLPAPAPDPSEPRT